MLACLDLPGLASPSYPQRPHAGPTPSFRLMRAQHVLQRALLMSSLHHSDIIGTDVHDDPAKYFGPASRNTLPRKVSTQKHNVHVHTFPCEYSHRLVVRLEIVERRKIVNARDLGCAEGRETRKIRRCHNMISEPSISNFHCVIC
jgi:hypothetical protein